MTKLFAGSSHGGGIPNERAVQNNRITAIAECEVPTIWKAAEMYERDHGIVTRDVVVGLDPLADHPELLLRRDQMFFQSNPSYDFIYGQVVCENYQTLRNAISYIMTSTSTLQSQLQ